MLVKNIFVPFTLCWYLCPLSKLLGDKEVDCTEPSPSVKLPCIGISSGSLLMLELPASEFDWSLMFLLKLFKKPQSCIITVIITEAVFSVVCNPSMNELWAT